MTTHPPVPDSRPCILCGTTARETVLETACEARGKRTRFRLERCRSCGLVRTEPQLHGAALETFYDRSYYGHAKADDPDWVRRDQRYRTRFLTRLLPKGRILDVGCGLGLFLLALDPERWERCGVEPMPAAYEEASRRLGAGNVQLGGIEAGSWPDGSFDAITFWDVIEHVPEPDVTLRTAFRRLRPGGVVLLSAPDYGGYQARTFGEDWYGLSLPHHFHHFTRDTIRRLLEDAGFQVDTIEGHFGREDYHALKHSLSARCRRKHGPAVGRVLYYLLKPLLHPWEWLSTRSGGGSHLVVAARRPSVADRRVTGDG